MGEAVIIDVDQQDLEEYESMKNALENVDDLKTEADVDDVSIADWNEEPANVREYEALTCEEIFELDDDRIESNDNLVKEVGLLPDSDVKEEKITKDSDLKDSSKQKLNESSNNTAKTTENKNEIKK